MSRWKTPYNAKPTTGEINNEPSKTVPDQSMSMRELLIRHASGLSTVGGRTPIYNGEEHIPDVDRLDLSERHELIASNKQLIADMQEDLKRRQAAQNSPNKDTSTAAPSAAQAPEQKQPE